MEIEENHRSHKRSRVGNGNQATAKLDDDEDDGDQSKELTISNNNNGNPMRPWHHPSSRIFRVSRASGGKDRHSKVYTAKGLRDRRVRLSVSTAIQFYDLQDRLGYDQPSKAIEWLIKAAESAISELPSLDTTFPEPPLELQQQQKQLNIEKAMPIDSGIDAEAELSYNQQQHSSASETSKGSVLSLSRSESRVKARERARERVKEKDRDEAQIVSHHQNLDPRLNSQGSFTKLLTEGSISSSTAVTASSTANFIHNQLQNLPPVTSTMDYFRIQSSLLGQQQQQQQKTTTHQSSSSGFSLQSHFGNISPIGMMPLFTNAGDHPATEMQQFSFDHFFPVATSASSGGGGDYNLNFSISPSLAGFHRGTLQSNSTTPHHHHRQHQQHQFQFSHHHQVQAHRFSSALDGSGVPFFFGAPATTAPAASHSQNPYPLPAGFDGYKHLELNGKGKS